MARPFISHDGTDPQGNRAEVVVEVHTGTVKGIEEMEKVAKVVFAGDGLTRPVHGYIQIDDPVLDIAKEAKKSKETVEYRIEIVRKPGIDRTIAMSELRKDTEIAQVSVKKLLAGINGHLTKEAVTDPAEDTGGDGVYKASASDRKPASNGGGSSVSPESALAALDASVKAGVPHEALSALVASVILSGVSPADAIKVAYPSESTPNNVQQTRSREEPVFRKYNTDGTLNLGSSQVIAGVSSENFTRRILSPLVEKEDFAETVEKIASIILAIADKIQLGAYGNTGNSDRMAGSHTRIRGVVYDIIENTFLPPVLEEKCTDEDIFQWVGKVGSMARNRFNAAIAISESQFNFSSLRGATEKPVAVVESVENTKEEKVEAPVVKNEAPAETPETVVEPQVENGSDVSEDDDMNFELYEVTMVESPNPQVPTTAVVNKLKAMITAFGVPAEDLNKVGSLIEYSFGVRQAKEVPSAQLKSFIEFYKEHGKENLHGALKNIDDLLGE